MCYYKIGPEHVIGVGKKQQNCLVLTCLKSQEQKKLKRLLNTLS